MRMEWTSWMALVLGSAPAVRNSSSGNPFRRFRRFSPYHRFEGNELHHVGGKRSAPTGNFGNYMALVDD